MTSVQLYVYDLSKGLARQLSLQMTGKQIDGIWHTSVVVFGKEIFYGQGISMTAPGRSHHGTPMQVIDMGETAIDEETFKEYLDQIREHYTSDKYHLLDFNCNSFTNDCIGFLTGGAIPSWIKDLPQDFLSTPFGQALRPTIDNMFRRPQASTAPSPAVGTLNGQLGSSLLQAVAAQATSGQAYPTPTPTPPLSGSAGPSLTSPLHITTNPASFASLLKSHRCVTAFFTSQTCPPCHTMYPIFEDLAHKHASSQVAFTKVDVGTGSGYQVSSQFKISATPTFLFFFDGQMIHKLEGAQAGELRTQVDLLLYQAFPPHPHTRTVYQAIRDISLQPILFSQNPSWDAALGKLGSFIDAAKTPEFDGSQVKDVLANRVIPFLRTRFLVPGPGIPTPPTVPAELFSQWSSTTLTLANVLPPHELFPLVDFWRLGMLDKSVSSWAAATRVQGTTDITELLLKKALAVVEMTTPNPRNLILTTLRMLANGFSNPILARYLLDETTPTPSRRENITALLISTLLHNDVLVRTAAASLAFNIAAHYQRPLVEALRSGHKGDTIADKLSDGQGDWEVEIVSAIVEALNREKTNEDVVHRLTASLALYLHLSPFWTQLTSFMEVLQVKEIVSGKLLPGGCGEKGVQKKEVKKLLENVVAMCS